MEVLASGFYWLTVFDLVWSLRIYSLSEERNEFRSSKLHMLLAGNNLRDELRRCYELNILLHAYSLVDNFP